MPKLKTKSGVKKRFSKTATGKIRRTKAGKRHNLGCKSQKMKRNARGTTIMRDCDFDLINIFMPYN